MTQDHAQSIRREHEAVQRCEVQSIAHAIRAGELLIEVKESLQHGAFGKWLAANVEFSERTAQVYIKMAKLDQKRSGATHLSIRKALKETRKKRKRTQPSITDREYRAIRQQLVNSLIARCIPSVKRAAESMLGTEELMQLRESLSSVVDQYIRRADDHKTAQPNLILVKRETA